MSATAKASWITPQKDSESGLMFPVCSGEIQNAPQRMNKVPKSGESDAAVRSAAARQTCLFVLVGPDHGRLLSGLSALLRLAPLKLWGGEALRTRADCKKRAGQSERVCAFWHCAVSQKA